LKSFIASIRPTTCPTATSRPATTNGAEPGAGEPYQTPVSGALMLGRLGASAVVGATPSTAPLAAPALGLTVLAVLGPGLEKVILAIGLLLSPPFARVVHGATLSLKEQEFLSAARAVGAGHIRLMRVHILPNMVGEIAVLVSVLTASAIRVEASLSFIGLGISPPTPTWGNMIRDGTTHLINAPWLSVFPGLAILLTVLAFNLLGDGLRDVLDPKLQR